MSPEDSQFNTPKKKMEIKPDIDMVAFRAEINTLITKRKGKYINMIEITEVNPDDLTEEDAAMWHKANNGLVTHSEFTEYAKNIKSGNNRSRKRFRSVIANKIIPILAQAELKELQNQK
jgi:hypothetical protein